MHINLIEIWAKMGLPVRLVAFLLTAQVIASIAVTLDRLLLLRLSSVKARLFAAQIEPFLDAREYDKVLTLARGERANHFMDYLCAGLKAFVERRAKGGSASEAADLARRALARKGDMISRDLNKGLNVIASTGSTAPFVGLLGTVLGIIGAFRMISVTGSGGIGAIGAALGEALVVTGYGLVVAIPSVLVFNYLTARIANYESGLFNAGGELVDRLEFGEDASGAPAEPAKAAE